jgi:membrane protease YdiL (CAAX protease family)
VNEPKNFELEPLTRSQILVIMGITAIIILIIAKLWQKIGSVEILAWEISPFALIWGLALAGLISIGSSIIYHFWPAYRQSADAYLELVIKPLTWSDLIWLGLLPGLSEELLFRGIMLPALGFNLAAVIISSCLFGILHMNGTQQWSYALWATIVGFLLGYIALITSNLIIPVIAHVVTNFCSGLVWKVKNTSNLPSR